MQLSSPRLNVHNTLQRLFQNRLHHNPQQEENELRPHTKSEPAIVFFAIAATLTAGATASNTVVSTGFKFLLFWFMVSGPALLDSAHLGIEQAAFPADHLNDEELKNRISIPSKSTPALTTIYKKLSSEDERHRTTDYPIFMPALIRQAHDEASHEAKLWLHEWFLSPERLRVSSILEKLVDKGYDDINSKLANLNALLSIPKLLIALAKQPDDIKLKILEKHGKEMIDIIQNPPVLSVLCLVGDHTVEQFQFICTLKAAKLLCKSNSNDVKTLLKTLITSREHNDFNLKSMLHILETPH